VDIAALSEMRLHDTGVRRENSHTFFWTGNPTGSRLQGTSGVGFAISNQLISQLTEQPKPISDRLMSLRLATSNTTHIHLISAYAPTLCSAQTDIEAFYQELRGILSCIPRNDSVVLLGDFNARVGSDWASWPRVLGKHGRGTYNSNGEQLLQVCSEYS
jgi:exonuclease III